MYTTTKRFAYLAPIILRLALAAVVLWFGVSQTINQAMWVRLIPSWAITFSGLPAEMIVRFNGIFELLTGGMLVLGIFTQWVAFFLSVHLLVITIHLGFNPVGVRDFGLTFAMLALALLGDDAWTLFPRKKIWNQN